MGNRLEMMENYGKVEVKKDCMMYKSESDKYIGECEWLNVLECRYDKCAFYKPKKD